jgi:hypothetical protein
MNRLHSRLELVAVFFVLFVFVVPLASAQTPGRKPTVWMCPPAFDGGKHFAELFEKPDEWQQTRQAIDVLGYSDLNLKKHFSDEQLQTWLPKLNEWGIKLGLEVGAIKAWGQTGEKDFKAEQPIWQWIERSGGKIHAIAMDEPLCCCRKEIHQPDDYAVRETANYIAMVRKHYPQMLIGEIEPYPFIPLTEQMVWIEALEKRLAELQVRGLDFYRLDVNWVEFNVQSRGSWREVRKLEQYCRKRKLPFSLIYWASGYPALEHRGLADDAASYVSIMQQGYDYALVDGSPDQIVVQSWIDAPSRSLPETADYTFARTMLDFTRRFAQPDK